MNNLERAAVRSAINYLRLTTSGSYEVRSALAALRQINIDAEPGRPADATGDSFETLIKSMDGNGARTAKEWAVRLRNLVAAEMLNEEPNTPERPVRGHEVVELPHGSIVISSYSDGKPKISASARAVESGGTYLSDWYRVLYRAPKPIEVGDEITGKRADELPQDSVVQRRAGMYPVIKAVTGWRMGPGEDPFSSLAVEYGPTTTFRVLTIGKG